MKVNVKKVQKQLMSMPGQVSKTGRKVTKTVNKNVSKGIRDVKNILARKERKGKQVAVIGGVAAALAALAGVACVIAAIIKDDADDEICDVLGDVCEDDE